MMSISRSTASLDKFRSESKVDKLGRLSKSYSLTNLSQRKRSSSSEKTFDKDTLSSRSKLKVNRKKENIRDKTLNRLSRNIERDRNSEQVFSKAYRERWEGVMNQTTSRTESKKRDSAALSGSAGRTRLPPISKPTARQSAPGPRARSGKQEVPAPRARSGRNVNEEPARPARSGNRKDEDVRKKSGRVEESNRGGRGGRNLAGAVNRANPGRGIAGTVNRVIAGNRGGAAHKPADDVKLNKKYAGVVCETCKLQIHEKLKRGYTKYRSLEKMKSCEKCLKSVIDFDFYQICVACAKDLQVCAKCACGSTQISGERFVEVVRHGVTENILSMNDRELSQFAKKHAKIGIVEQQIEMIEDEASDKPAATTRTPSARSSKSRATSSAKSKRSSNQSPKQIEAKLKMEEPLNVSTSKSKKVSKNTRSMTSSSSPLVGESENETCLSSTESDEAYGSGHISSVSDVKTVRSATTRSGTKSNRSRQKSSEILRQIRSLTSLQVTSPSSAQSVIREIRSLTEMECYDDDNKSPEGDRRTPNTPGKADHTPVATPQPSYTPFSATSDKSNLHEDSELTEYMNSCSRTPNFPPITITGTVKQASHSHPQLEPGQVSHPQLEPGQVSHPQLEQSQVSHPQLEQSQVSHPQLEPGQVSHPRLEPGQVSADLQQEVREYSPSPPVVTITTLTKESVGEESSGDSSDDSATEEHSDSTFEGIQLDNITQNKELEEEIVSENAMNVETGINDGEETESLDDEAETVTDETESIAEVEEHVSQTGGVPEPVDTASQLADIEVTSTNESTLDSVSVTPHNEKPDESDDGNNSSEVAVQVEADEDAPVEMMETETETVYPEEVLEINIPVEYETFKEPHEIAGDDVEESNTNEEVLDAESQQTLAESEDIYEDTAVIKIEELKSGPNNNELVMIEDVLEDETSPEPILSKEDHIKIADHPREEILETIESTTDFNDSSEKEEVTEIVTTENHKTDDSKVYEIVAAESRQFDDVRVEDVDDDHFLSMNQNIRTTEVKKLVAEELAEDSSDTTDEARLSSELETFMGDTPKSIDSSEDSPRQHQTRSQDPSSTEVQVSSSASDLEQQADENSEDSTPRSRKPVFERQISENADEKESGSVLDTVGQNFEDFSQFYQNHAFDIVEIHKNGSPEEILYEEEEQQDYYDQCYEQYQYNVRLRIRLEDIPEEGTLSKESTYLSRPFTDTMDTLEKEDTVVDREESERGGKVLQNVEVLEKDDSVVEKEESSLDKEDDLDRETSMVVNDIVNCALIRASLSLMDEKQ